MPLKVGGLRDARHRAENPLVVGQLGNFDTLAIMCSQLLGSTRSSLIIWDEHRSGEATVTSRSDSLAESAPPLSGQVSDTRERKTGSLSFQQLRRK